MSVRWRKVIADLWSNKTRTLLTALTIAVGVFAMGISNNAGIRLLGDMDIDYQAANPHAGLIYTDLLDEDFLEVLRRVPGVAQVQGRDEISANVLLANGDTEMISIAANPPLNEMTIDLLRPADPHSRLPLAPLQDREVYLDRTALAKLPVKPGDTIEVEMMNGTRRSLRVADIVHDVNAYPSAFGAPVYAYTSLETLAWLGGPDQFSTVIFTVTGSSQDRRDQTYVEGVAQALADRIEDSGREVYYVSVYAPGRHFAADISQGVVVVLNVLSIVTIFLGIFLIINTLTSLMRQHVRQIGIMKALGGHTRQIASMYLVLVLAYGLLALLIAVPLSSIVGYQVAIFLSQFLNFDLGPFRPLPEVILIQAAIALGVPLLAALAPILQGARLTVREAINNYGLSTGKPKTGLLERLTFLPSTLSISLRNTFRRKLRLALTLFTLTISGSMFIAVLNLWQSFDATLDEVQGYFLADVNIAFGRQYRIHMLESLLQDIPGVASTEGWGGDDAYLIDSDGTSSVTLSFLTPPSDSQLIKPVITAGRWLRPEDENAVVIGNHLLKVRPDLQIGDTLKTEIYGKRVDWKIVGFYRLAGNTTQPVVYANYEYFSRLINQSNMIYALRIKTSDSSPATQTRVAKAVEQRLKEKKILVGQILTGQQWIQSQTSTLDVLVYFLLVMAILMGLVGGLSLMGTLSINVLERTREIGVMRAIGAANGSVLQIVLVEGMFIGLLSWLLAIFLSIPITMGLVSGVGSAILGSSLSFALSPWGLMAWLACDLLIALLASILPARNAIGITVRSALEYE